MTDPWDRLQAQVVACRRCSRLVAWRERVGRERKAAHRDETYWARPVPALGDAGARVLVLGLAPGAHGANRTGRMFTGDACSDWLMASLHRTGFASHGTSQRPDDGLELTDLAVTGAVRCAPPGNKPTPSEIAACAPYFHRELALLPRLAVVVALGGVAWLAYLRWAAGQGVTLRPRPRFGHGVVVGAGLPHTLIGSYHPSQLNTRTGRLTEAMTDAVFRDAARLAGGGAGG
ncbi:MAG: uracil-DNA glycosylase [Myxococcota bacterium]